ncbi:MAG: aminotransferase class V-fold PLP-dependent enzyme, partial [Desulfotomaculales bacterium]
RALAADQLVYRARRSLARLFNVRDVSRIVFTGNVTESLNLAMKGLLRPGDHVVTTGMEHNAVWRCLKVLEAKRGVRVTAVPCGPDGTLDPERVTAAFRPETRLVVMLHASNVTGTLLPVAEVGAAAARRGIPLLVDAAQTAGVYPIDVEKMNISLLAFTGHKGLLGPPGTGGLYVAPEITLEPLKEGGTGGESILERQPDTLPDRFEAGTLNVPGIAGLGAAADFILAEGIERIRAREEELTAYALGALRRLDGITVYGPGDPARQVAVISINVLDMKPEEVALLLDTRYGIEMRAGLHCAPAAHRTIGTIGRGTLRLGLGYFNTKEEIDCLAEALREIIRERLKKAGSRGVRGSWPSAEK